MRHYLKLSALALAAACGDATPGDGFGTVGLTHAPQPSTGTGSTSGDDTSTTSGDVPTTGDAETGTTGTDTTGTDTTASTTASDVCGDGEKTGDEQCDLGAGNADNGACTFDCRLPVCGDGLVQLGVEACDDGGTRAGDGCDADCELEGDGTEVEVPLSGLALPIPNDGYDGFPGSMACADLPVAAAGVVTDVRVQVGIEHPFIGDLVIKLWSPKGTQLTLMSLPGGAEEADDGKSDSTEGSDIAADFPVTFQKDGETAELMGQTLGLDQAVCRDDGVCDYSPYPGKGPGKDFGDFTGEPADGVWRLCVGDTAFADKGTFESVTLTLVL
jgi:cysteine-rich repeat protein